MEEKKQIETLMEEKLIPPMITSIENIEPEKVDPFPVKYYCGICREIETVVKSGTNFCTNCGYPYYVNSEGKGRIVAKSGTIIDSTPQDWECLNCGGFNVSFSDYCSSCGSSK